MPWVGAATRSRRLWASQHGHCRAGAPHRVLGAVGLKPKPRPILPLSPSHFPFFPLLPLLSSLALSWWFVVLVLRWCRPVRVGDVVVVLGARRRQSFQREGPNGSALLVEVRLLNSGRPFRVSGSVGGDRKNRVLGMGRGIWLRIGAGRSESWLSSRMSLICPRRGRSRRRCRQRSQGHSLRVQRQQQ
ncbi:hypothetical protein Taro_043830 [Colocasia esculenta]|uniref:Uncharacterized protein n=1 Tax=Colocasia esculenta TaxID=4460 RepID=A0A843X4M6_COLES|nr:hypothetical protein [Colocasia esculenta]